MGTMYDWYYPESAKETYFASADSLDGLGEYDYVKPSFEEMDAHLNEWMEERKK